MSRRHWIGLLRAGALAWNSWRTDNPSTLVRLRREWLDELTLFGMDFAECDFADSVLAGSDLRESNFSGANLRGADLRRCDLRHANFTRADTRGVDWEGAVLNGTLFLDTELGEICSADVAHEGPSFIDLRTVVRSSHVSMLPDFLVATGLSPAFAREVVGNVRRLGNDGIKRAMRSTFLSYGTPDQEFARTLNAALKACGVSTFFFPESAVPGERLQKVMRVGVNAYDRIIVICSRASLRRPGVLNEVQEALAREARDGGAEYVIPVCLDDALFERWEGEHESLRQALADRVVADFRPGRVSTAPQFELAVRELMRALGASERPDPAIGSH